MLTAKSGNPVLLRWRKTGPRRPPQTGQNHTDYPHEPAGGTLPGRTVGPNRGSDATDDPQSGDKPTRRPSGPQASLDQATQSTHGSIRWVPGRAMESMQVGVRPRWQQLRGPASLHRAAVNSCRCVMASDARVD